MGGTPAAGRLETDLSLLSARGAFSDGELDGLAEPVRRYFRAAIAPGAPLAACARLRLRGRIKLGLWLPFRARQVLAPHSGFVWGGARRRDHQRLRPIHRRQSCARISRG